jgi:hypothetical protein
VSWRAGGVREWIGAGEELYYDTLHKKKQCLTEINDFLLDALLDVLLDVLNISYNVVAEVMAIPYVPILDVHETVQ